MKTERRVLGNMAVLGSGSFVAQLTNFVFVIIIARAFGPAFLGHYSLSMAISAFAVVFVGFGSAQMLVRDIGRDAVQGGAVLRALFPVQLGFAITAWVAIVSIGAASGLDAAEVSILAMIAGYQILVRLSNILLSESKGRQKMTVVAIVHGGTPMLVLAMGASLLWLHGSAIVTVAAMPISALVFFVVAATAATRLGGRILTRWDRGTFLAAIRQTRQFFLIQLLSSAYERLGIVILGVLATQAMVGEFAAGERIIATLGVLVGVMTGAALPALSHLAATDSARLLQLASRLIRFSWLIGLPVTTGLFLFSEDIIGLLFGASYLSSAAVLQTASVLMMLRALRAVLAPLSMATGRQSNLAVARAVALVALLASAPFLIAWFDAVGLAAAMVVAESGLLAVLISRLAARGQLPVLVRPAVRVGGACGFALGVGILGAEWPPVYRILLPTTTGIVGLWLFRAVRAADLQFLCELVRGKRRAAGDEL